MAVAPLVNMGMPNLMATMGMGGMTIPVSARAGTGGGLVWPVHPRSERLARRNEKPIVKYIVDNEGDRVITQEINKYPPLQPLPEIRIDMEAERARYDIQEQVIAELKAELEQLRMSLEKRDKEARRVVVPKPVRYKPKKFNIIEEEKIEVNYIPRQKARSVPRQRAPEPAPQAPLIFPDVPGTINSIVSTINQKVLSDISNFNMTILKMMSEFPKMFPPPPPFPPNTK